MLIVSYLCLAAAMAIVGAYVGASKALVIVFPVFLLAGLRFAIAAVAMAPWLRAPAGAPPLDPVARRLVFLESFFGNFLFSICMLYGVSKTSALAAGVILAALPAMVAVLSRLLLGERIAPRVWAGIACAVAGIAVVSLARAGAEAGDEGLDTGTLVGNLLMFGAVTCEALYVVIGKRLTDTIGPKRISALINLWGLVLVLPLAIWQGIGFPWGAIDASSWSLVVAYSIAASIVTVWLWMTGLKRVPASQASIFTIFLPITTAAIGVAVFGETISAPQAAAFVLALAGVVLATRPRSADVVAP